MREDKQDDQNYESRNVILRMLRMTTGTIKTMMMSMIIIMIMIMMMMMTILLMSNMMVT